MANEDQEWDAAGLLCGLLNARAERTDVRGGPSGQHDFLIHLPGFQIALEVTTTTVGEVEGFWDSVHREDWRSDTTSWGWSLSLRPGSRGQMGAKVRAVRKECERHLVRLEHARCDRFGEVHPVPRDSADAVEAEAELVKLGVRSGRSSGEPRPGERPWIGIGTAGPGGVVDNRVINEAVEREASENADKLARADADERHLFVWVPSNDHEASAAMSGMYGPPDDPPKLPLGIDVVWVAAWQPGPTVPTTILWRVRPPSPWEVPSVRYRDPRGDDPQSVPDRLTG